MVAYTQLLLGLVAITKILAVPVAESNTVAPPDLQAGAGDNVNFTFTTNGYSATFSVSQEFTVGKGWTVGAARNISFSGSTTVTSGTVQLSVYGWTINPLVEYYIQEYCNGAPQGTKVGTVESDGSTYDIWKNPQVNQPSIVGTATFLQYISVRQDQRTDSGTINTGNHFAAWKATGLNMGSFLYQVLSTQGSSGASGSSHYSIASS